MTVKQLNDHWRGVDFVDGWNAALDAVEEEQELANVGKETT